MHLSVFDYTVLVVLYMLVSLRGDQMLRLVKFNKLANALPFDRASSSALLHGLLFVALIFLIGVFSRKVATYATKVPQKKEKKKKPRR